MKVNEYYNVLDQCDNVLNVTYTIIYLLLQSIIFKGGYVFWKSLEETCNLIFFSISIKLFPIVKLLLGKCS